jgi:hypothetical protein
MFWLASGKDWIVQQTNTQKRNCFLFTSVSGLSSYSEIMSFILKQNCKAFFNFFIFLWIWAKNNFMLWTTMLFKFRSLFRKNTWFWTKKLWTFFGSFSLSLFWELVFFLSFFRFDIEQCATQPKKLLWQW